MSNNAGNGFQITPLVMAVAGALWLILVGIGGSILSKQSLANDKLTELVTSQKYDRRDIDEVKVQVKAVSERVTLLEQKK